MSILTVENVSHGFGGRQILEKTSLRLLKGEHIGLVGANGEGKSTILSIITGKIQPDEGTVEWCRHSSTGYLDQFSTLTPGKSIREVLREAFVGLFDMEQEILQSYDKMGDCSEAELEVLMQDVGEMQEILEQAGFYIIDARIEEYANGLGLGEIGLDQPVDALSGGQRAKVLLTKLLLQSPMILILDEPTNFLDENHIRWLKNYLQNYENAFILVSHDTPFLNDVVNVIYHVEKASLTRYSGNYEYFSEMHALKKRQVEAAYEKQQKEIAVLEDFVARNKARAATSNMAKSRQKKLDKMDIIALGKEKPKPSFGFRLARSTGRIVMEARGLVLGYDAPLTRPMDLILENRQKVAIRGVNGLGKTTLLKTLLGLIPPIAGSVELDQFLMPAYFEQEEDASDDTALEVMQNEFPGLTQGEVRGALARCGLTNEHITSQMRVLSGGENAKVRLGLLMQREYNLLVLDEPTNHLDVDAKEELRRAVDAFKGTVLLVSHEPEFYEGVVSHLWDLSEWTTKII